MIPRASVSVVKAWHVRVVDMHPVLQTVTCRHLEHTRVLHNYLMVKLLNFDISANKSL